MIVTLAATLLASAAEPIDLPAEFDVSARWFLHYAAGTGGSDTHQGFSVSRGYTTLKIKPTDWLQARTTMDLYEDDDGWELRFKYLYGKFSLPVESRVITKPWLEVGLAHVPWHAYEERLYRYRMQGKVYLERQGLFNSADLGLTAGFDLGPQLSQDQVEALGGRRGGLWGSVAGGVYNGGGYHGLEQNGSEVVMLRTTVRPLGPVLPHLNLSWFGVTGQGNTEEALPWRLHAGMVSFEHPWVHATVQASTGLGDQDGERVDAAGAPLRHTGGSAFVELKPPDLPVSAMVRGDWVRWDTESPEEEARAIGAVAWWFYEDCALVADLDYVVDLTDTAPDAWEVKATLQVDLP